MSPHRLTVEELAEAVLERSAAAVLPTAERQPNARQARAPAEPVVHPEHALKEKSSRWLNPSKL